MTEKKYVPHLTVSLLPHPDKADGLTLHVDWEGTRTDMEVIVFHLPRVLADLARQHDPHEAAAETVDPNPEKFDAR